MSMSKMLQQNGGRPPLSYQSFLKIAGEPSWNSSPVSISLSGLPPVGNVGNSAISEVPSIGDLGYDESDEVRRF